LLEFIEKIQDDSKEQFQTMNERIIKLESTVSQLTSIISNNMNYKTNNNIYSTNCSNVIGGSRTDYNTIKKEDFDSFGAEVIGGVKHKTNSKSISQDNDSNVWSEILQSLKVI
jgi:hypothetical protein